jgi:hypothetical protein
MTATRRLAAILAAGVAGYSRLIGADEERNPQPPQGSVSSKLPAAAAYWSSSLKLSMRSIVRPNGNAPWLSAMRHTGQPS